MEDNFDENSIGIIYPDDEDNTDQNNSLANNMGELSEFNPPSSISKITSTFQLSSLKKDRESLNDNKIPYPDAEEIPLIKIKNENYFENGQDIDSYIKSFVKFDDNKFNICSQCPKRQIKYFCKKCNKNICNECCNICWLKNHVFISLQELSKDIEEYKINIKLIISKYILSKKKQNNDGIEKENKNYDEIIDDTKTIEIEENPFDYTNDILLINAIIEKNYTNYFHYMNIKECFNYMKSKYEGSIIIKYKIRFYKLLIKIFGFHFVKNNKNICHIIYKEDNYKLMEYIELNELLNNEILEIKLIGVNSIINASYMFYDCAYLDSLPDIFKWNTNNVIDMDYMLYGCESLKYLPDISKWDTSNVTNMSEMFCLCKSLTSLPDISKWNINNVIDMSYMFDGCISLKSLPDISKWNISNAKNIRNIFYKCRSLISLPDLSKWNTNNVTNMSEIFRGCESLISLPDISKWNTSKVTDMCGMFRECLSLNSLPDISKWNTSNVTNMSYMFYKCICLNLLPDISEWYINNVTDIGWLFSGCESLNSLPDISKWNTNNVTDMCWMFYDCISLKFVSEKKFSDFLKFWKKEKTVNVYYKSFM